jgi:small-conductance mechanosensitive channel
MNTPAPEHSESITKKLILPFIVSALLGGFIFYGGDAYKVIGLEAVESFVTIFGYVLGIAEFFILAILLQRIVQHVILDRLVAAALGAPAPRLLSQLANVIIYALAISAIMGLVFKKDLTVVLTAFGGAGLVIGLALQKMISDLFSGLTINLDRSIKLGDYIYLAKLGEHSVEGEVKEISWRTLRLVDTNNNTFLIPNSQVSAGTLINFSAPTEFFKVKIIVTLDVRVPVERALRILRTAALEASPQFSPANAPPPKVVVKAITLQGVEYSVEVFPTFKTRSLSQAAVQQQVLHHLHCAGLTPAREKMDDYRFIETQDFQRPSHSHLAKLLAKEPLFQDLTENDRQLLADFALMRQLPTNTLVVSGGEIASSLFLVVEGLLISEEWRKKIGKKTSDSAVVLGPGTVVNGAEMLAGSSCETVIRTKGDALLYEINYTTIEKLFRQNSVAGRYLSQRVAEKLSSEIAKGKHSYYQQNGINSVEQLKTMVYKNLRRSYAHLNLN